MQPPPTTTHQTNKQKTGFTLVVNIYCFGHLSGGHFNPSITISRLIRNSPDSPSSDSLTVFGYFVSQIIGGLCGGAAASLCGGRAVAKVYPNLGDGVEEYQGFFCELFFTYILCMVDLHAGTSKRLG